MMKKKQLDFGREVLNVDVLCCIQLQTVILSHLLVNSSHKQSNNEGEVSVGASQQSLQLFS